MDVEYLKNEIAEQRAQKDAFFKSGYESPVPFEEREYFKGLNYYDPDPRFRFELELYEHAEKKTVKTEDTKGNERRFLRWGEFRFTIDGKQCTLQANKGDPQEERLFVPFRDESSGKETYGAGRYMDLNVGGHRTAEGKWILDFNNAYNPWCAYSELYACPFVDPENWLRVNIRAGEKDYSGKKEA